MKRFDRAMYALVLLALLADVARSYASAPLGPAGNDAAGTLILHAATQLQASATGEAILGLRRSGLRRSVGYLPPFARTGKPRSLRLSAWTTLFGPSTQWNPAEPVDLSAVGLSAASGVARFRTALESSPSPGIFDHSGSPAP